MDLLRSGDRSRGGVDDQSNLLVLYEVDHIGTSFGKLQQWRNGNLGIRQFTGRPGTRNNFETELVQTLTDLDRSIFVHIADAEKNGPRGRQGWLGGHLGFGVGQAERAVDTHDLPG